jgi:hypothetical protein
MTYQLRAAFYVLMLLLVGVVIVGVYFDRPRDDPAASVAPAAAAEDNAGAAQPVDGPVTDARPEAANQA